MQCDERRPICFHCENSRRDCHGWAEEFAFIQQQDIPATSRLPSRPLTFKEPLSHFEKRKRVYKRPVEETKLDSEADIASSHSHSSSVSHSDSASLDICPRPVPLSPAARLAGELVHLLNIKVVRGPTILYIGEYFEGLPAHLGRSDCLDAAVEYFLLLQQPLHNPADTELSGPLKARGRALRLLRRQLSCADRLPEAETLCSALILFASEVSASLSFVSWILKEP
jgi:hypothetical protein